MQPSNVIPMSSRRPTAMPVVPQPISNRIGPVTAHAWQRMSGRGFSPDDIDQVLSWGRVLHKWDGALCHFVGRREVDLARRHGVDLEGVEGLHVLTATDSGVIITAWRNRRPRLLRF
jgi:hypothetical protein